MQENIINNLGFQFQNKTSQFNLGYKTNNNNNKNNKSLKNALIIIIQKKIGRHSKIIIIMTAFS
jgi:hypothetical protein